MIESFEFSPWVILICFEIPAFAKIGYVVAGELRNSSLRIRNQCVLN